MTLNRCKRRIALAVVANLGMLVGLSWPPGQAGAASPTAAARKCRAAIAAGGRNAVGVGLTTLDACHVRRDHGKFSGDCNVIASSAVGFARAQARAEATINARCASGNPVLTNYPDGVAAIFPVIRGLLEESGAEVQGAPDIAGDPSTRKARSKCHKAIGKARSGVVKDVVKRSTGCQKKLDKSAATFGALDASCIASPGGSLGKGRNLISKACNGVLGSDVGSCASLPDCVLTEATDSGQAMAKAIYSTEGVAEPQCGNGAVEGDEQCDDGNRDDADACRNDCSNAICGDGVIASPMEECDDANGVPNDGCTGCVIDGATCGASGVDAIVSLVFEQSNLNNLAGLIVNLGYDRAGVSIPGSADNQSVLDRVQDLTGKNAAIWNDQDTDSNGVDDNLLNFYATPDPIAPGPLERVRFDCTPGAFIRPSDFDCDPVGPSDTTGNPLTLSRDLLDCRVTRVSVP
jgi:cysteine-rich repeat protein